MEGIKSNQMKILELKNTVAKFFFLIQWMGSTAQWRGKRGESVK